MKLTGKTAVITGGNSGIEAARVALDFSKLSNRRWAT